MDAATGILSTVAGTTPTPYTGSATQTKRGYTGNGMTATAAKLFYPATLALDAAGNLYIADTNNQVIRKVSVGTQIITTTAGACTDSNTCSTTYNGNHKPANQAYFSSTDGIALD